VSSRNSKNTPRASGIHIQKVEEDSLESLSSFNHGTGFRLTDRGAPKDGTLLARPVFQLKVRNLGDLRNL